jgi:hypothetical protein
MGYGSGMGMWGFGLLLVVGVGLLVVLAARALGGGVTRGGPRVGPSGSPRDAIGTEQPQDAPAPERARAGTRPGPGDPRRAVCPGRAEHRGVPRTAQSLGKGG